MKTVTISCLLTALHLFLVVVLASIHLLPQFQCQQTYEIDTVAGQRFYDGEGGLALHVLIHTPIGVAFHPVTEDLFIADAYNHVIRKIDKASGVITTVAGTPTILGSSGDGGLATKAHLNFPTRVAFSPDGHAMYIADYANSRVRMVKDGIITTVAGNGTFGFGEDNVLANSTSLNGPHDIAMLPTTGDLVIVDRGNHRIRKVNSDGIISTIAGTGMRTGDEGAPLGDNEPATHATLSNPHGIAANSDGDIFVADQSNYRVRRIDAEGVITTVAGTGTSGTNEDTALATSVKIGAIDGLAINSMGDLFMADFSNNCIRKVHANSKVITTVAGICGPGSSEYLGDNVSAISTKLYSPTDIAVKNNGKIVIADSNNHRIRQVDTNEIITTIVGGGASGFSGVSSIAIDARLNNPKSVTTTNDGAIIISDYGNRKIRKIDRNGIVTVIAGSGAKGFGGDGGSALNAFLNNAGKVVVTDDGDVLFADTGNNRIRKVLSSGVIVTVAGDGTTGFTNDGVLATQTALNRPQSVAYKNGEIFIADTGNHRVIKILIDGTTETVAGSGTSGYSGDGDLAIHAKLNEPVSIVVNSSGKIFISDEGNHIVRMVDNGIISTFAGTPDSGNYVGDGHLATNAKLNSPQGLAINNEGELFIADTDNDVIRKVDKDGIISTVVTKLSSPIDVSVGLDGELFIVQSDIHQIMTVDNNGGKMKIVGTSEAGSAISDFHLPATAPLVFASSVSVLSDTVLIVADTYNHMIKMIDINAKSISPLNNPTGLSPMLSYPRGTTIVNNEIYFADYGNHCIRKIDLQGAISDVVGVCGTGGSSSNGMPAVNAHLFFPSSVVVAANGDEVFIADSGNHIIRKVSGGIITTIAGIAGQAKFSGNNAQSSSSHLYEPTDLAIAPNKEELYFSDHRNHCIRKIDLNSDIISTVAGQCGTSGFTGDGDLATNAHLYLPRGLAFTKSGDLLIADFGNSVIRKVDIDTGIIVTIAGVGESVGFSGDGGSSTDAQFTHPTGIAVSASGDFFIADFGDHLIRVVEPTHTCDGISNKDSTVCSGHGLCVSTDTCRCNSEYYGSDCSITTCFGRWSNDSSVCSNHGTCTSHDICICDIGYIGSDCSLVMCFGKESSDSTVCSGHGMCTTPNKCECEPYYTGSDCSIVSCFHIWSNETAVCSNHGKCIRQNICECNDGYHGSDCSILNCHGTWSNDGTVCSGNGQCVAPNYCTCKAGFENYICSDITCPENDCLKIIESQPRDEHNCSVPTFSAQFPAGINALNITWILTQLGGDIKIVVTQINPADEYVPNVANMYDGVYTVSARMYYKTQLGEVRLRIASIERKASCSVCAPGSENNCRFTVGLGFDNHVMDNDTTVSIHRMTPFTIKVLNHDSLNNDLPIERLRVQWDYPPTSSRTQSIGENISIRKSESGRELTISPTDPIVGMNQNVTIDITCRYQLPSRVWTSISFKIYTIPSKDITPANGFDIIPAVGHTLITSFVLEAKGWNSSNLTFSFSFHDPIDNVEIRLSQSNTSLINSTLPTGSIPNFNLTMRLRVFDLVTGDYGFAEKSIIVTPYYGEGLLTQCLSDVIEHGGDYREMIAIASQVSVASRREVKHYYDDLSNVVNKMVDYTKNQDVSQMDAVGIEQQMYVVDLVTRNRLIVSEQSKKSSLDIVYLIIEGVNRTTTSRIISNDALQNMVNIISNVADGGFKDQTVASKVLSTSEELATFVASDLYVDGSPSTVTSKNFQLTVSLTTYHLLVNQSIRIDGNNSGPPSDGFDIPSQFDIGPSREKDAIASSMLVFHEDPYSTLNDGSDREQVSSRVLDIKFKDVNGTVLPVANLTQPLMIYFDRRKANHQGACPEATFKCQYWSEDDNMWKSDGCYWVDSPTNGNHIACACNHTTSFSAFVLEKGDSCVKYAGIKITGLVFNSIYATMCILILIGLFITQQYQPVKSRFIAPFIGIIAIIVDSVIQGIVRNVLSLAAEQSASDAFSYVIMLTANPLFITSLFVFLWQQIRYLLLQNIYLMMPLENRSLRTKFMQLNRMLASKAIFTLVSVCVGSCVLAYFAILVGLAAHYNDSKQVKKRDSIVIVQAVSFASLLIILAMGILFTLIIDVMYSVRRETIGKARDSSTDQAEQVNVTRTKNIGFIRMHFVKDPLLFRVEVCLIFVVLLLIILLYSIGIATVVQQPRAKAPIMIVRTIIEILFMFCRIAAFGGFVFLMGLRAMARYYRTQSYEKVASESSLSSLSTESDSELQVLKILRHEIGYQLLLEYCQQEFSMENVLLWKELESIRTENLLMTTEQRKHILKYLKETYIDNNSARQLNISHKPRTDFLKVAKLEQPDAAEAEEAFKKLYGACMLNLSDTLTRFCSSEPYLNFQATSEMLVELKEDFVQVK